METIYKPPQGSHLFGKGSFVTFDPANLEAIGNKYEVSDSVFQRLPIIIVVGLSYKNRAEGLEAQLFGRKTSRTYNCTYSIVGI